MFLDCLFFFLHFHHPQKRKRLHIFDDVGVAAADFFFLKGGLGEGGVQYSSVHLSSENLAPS